jgi:hypothetical protein
MLQAQVCLVTEHSYFSISLMSKVSIIFLLSFFSCVKVPFHNKQQMVSVLSYLSIANPTATKTIKNSRLETVYVEENER